MHLDSSASTHGTQAVSDQLRAKWLLLHTNPDYLRWVLSWQYLNDYAQEANYKVVLDCGDLHTCKLFVTCVKWYACELCIAMSVPSSFGMRPLLLSRERQRRLSVTVTHKSRNGYTTATHTEATTWQSMESQHPYNANASDSSDSPDCIAHSRTLKGQSSPPKTSFPIKQHL